MCNTVSGKLVALFTLTVIACQSFPGVAMAYDISERIEAFTKSQIENSNKIIDTTKGQIDKFVDQGIAKIENKTLNGLSTLENLTGRNEQNSKTYKKAKTNFLESVGVGLGLIEGTKDISLDLYSLIAKVPTAPERLVNFAIDYNRDSDKYHKKVTTTVNSISDAAVFVAKNPLPVSAGIYQHVKNVYTEAKKDPLEYGKLGGKITANVGFLLVGGTQIKSLSSADKVEKAAKASSVAKNTGALFFTGNKFRSFLSAETASLNLGQGVGKIASTLSAIGKNHWSKKNVKLTIDDIKKSIDNGTPLPANKESLNLVAQLAEVDLTKASKIKVKKDTKDSGLAKILINREVEFYGGAFENPANLAVLSGGLMKTCELIQKDSNIIKFMSKRDAQEFLYSIQFKTVGSGKLAGENFAAKFPGYELSLNPYSSQYELVKKEALAAWNRGL